jgi:hypothetical protein
VVWCPMQDMTFMRHRQLHFPACVLQGQQQLAHGAEALLHVFVPGLLPGLWQQVGCLGVNVGSTRTGPYLYRRGGWRGLQHLRSHHRLALSVVSGSSAVCMCSPNQ